MIEFFLTVDFVVLQNRVDLENVRLDELTRGQIAHQGTASAIRIGPSPSFALLLVSMGQHYLVDNEVGGATIGERQDGDFERRVFFKLWRYRGLDATGVKLDKVIKPGLVAVRLQPIFLLEERALFVVIRLRTATRKRDC